MNRIGIRELRDNLTRTMRRVRAGESFEVTRDGEPFAVIAPMRKSRLDELIALGEARPATRRLELPLRPLPPTTGITASEALEEDRSGR